MSKTRDFLRRALTGAALAASLGFGVTQALASPQAVVVRQCNPQNPADNTCNQICPNGGACNLFTMRCDCFPGDPAK